MQDIVILALVTYSNIRARHQIAHWGYIMPEYSDIYIISDKRDKSTVDDFIEHFLPRSEESADEYEVPQYLDSPNISFDNASGLIEYCAKNKNIEHSIYWRSLENRKPEHGMVFYLEDGYVIYGLSTDAIDQPYANTLLEELKSYFGSDLGYVGHEASPDVSNLTEFKAQIEAHKP